MGIFPALALAPAPHLLNVAAAVPVAMIEIFHTVYTCVSFRHDARNRGVRVGLVHSFLAPLLITLAGSLVASAVLRESPSFVANWRIAVPYRLVLPWFVINFIPDSFLQAYTSTLAGAGPRILVNAHEALNKYRGLGSAFKKAGHMPLTLAVVFVASRGAASTTARCIESLLSHPSPGKIAWKQMCAVGTEHARYLILSMMLAASTSDYHPARMVVRMLQNSACRLTEVKSEYYGSLCDVISHDHIAQGTYSAVLLYLLSFYISKAMPNSRQLGSLQPFSYSKIKLA